MADFSPSSMAFSTPVFAISNRHSAYFGTPASSGFNSSQLSLQGFALPSSAALSTLICYFLQQSHYVGCYRISTALIFVKPQKSDMNSYLIF